MYVQAPDYKAIVKKKRNRANTKLPWPQVSIITFLHIKHYKNYSKEYIHDYYKLLKRVLSK